ncbi:MAG: hypothetical protein NTU85_02725 [Candidatus Kaiserbacteria bacterium]|nr:hypothetical protein [Candidatus Kaiserbacteria bacterium]
MKTLFTLFFQDSYWLAIFGLWVPTLLILIVSIMNSLSGAGTKKVMVFYLAMFAGVTIGTLVSKVSMDILVVMSAGGLAGMFAGAFAGAFAGGLVGMPAYTLTGSFAGGIACVFVGAFTGMFAYGENYVVLIEYVFFVLVACAMSFGIAKAVVFAKNIWNEAKMLDED